MMGDAYCNWEDDFDGVMVTFRGSKTDQFNLGCKRFVGKAGNSKCAIAAFRDWFEMQPGAWCPGISRVDSRNPTIPKMKENALRMPP